MIILTGASGGLGQALINDLCKIDDVIGTYHKTTRNLRQKDNLKYINVDICNENQINVFVQSNKDMLKSITVIHAAGISKDALTVNHDTTTWKKVIEVNLTANFQVTKSLLPLMVNQRWGRIIHISSIRVHPGTVSYSSSKSALLGMSSVLAKEYARFNITSNILTLGAFKAGMYEKLNEKQQIKLLNDIPSKKLGATINICNAVDFLIKSEFVNGSSIVIDGGAST